RPLAPTPRTAPTWLVQVHTDAAPPAASERFAFGGARSPEGVYAGRMSELFGDSTRGGDWAAVRLRVERGVIADADAPGLDEDLRGLTLLEAAAVGGEVLPVDADAVGVTLRLWLDPNGPDAERACCSPSAVLAARALCHARGVPHVTLDLREEFRHAVVESFVRGYRRGDTPNPCIRCNGSFRFAELLAFARRIGAARLATGHYARIVEREGRFLLARGLDPAKDQSYMLARLDPRLLERVVFPLGGQTKAETQAEAAAAGLPEAGRAESQEACFLAGDDYRAFLQRHGLGAEAGPIVDAEGRRVGEHDGFWRFTPGQRRGLGLAAGEPLYAVDTIPRTNTVVVGPREALGRTRVTARGRLYASVTRGEAKLRYRSPGVPASVTPTSSGFNLRLDEPAYGVARGQAAVLYEGDVVVGCGLITSSALV